MAAFWYLKNRSIKRVWVWILSAIASPCTVSVAVLFDEHDALVVGAGFDRVKIDTILMYEE